MYCYVKYHVIHHRYTIFICFLVAITWLRPTFCKFDVTIQSELNGGYYSKKKRAGILTLLEHCQASTRDILKLYNVGQSTIARIINHIKET